MLAMASQASSSAGTPRMDAAKSMVKPSAKPASANSAFAPSGSKSQVGITSAGIVAPVKDVFGGDGPGGVQERDYPTLISQLDDSPSTKRLILGSTSCLFEISESKDVPR